MAIDAGAAASALATNAEHFCAALPGAWARREGGLLAGVTGVALTTVNGVWTEANSVDEAMVEALLDEVATSGLPHCLQVRPALSAPLSQLAKNRGMTRLGETPLMVLGDPRRLGTAPVPEGCTLRSMSPDEAELHATVVAGGFGAPTEPFLQLLPQSLLRARGVRTYLAEVDGEAVATGFGCTLGNSVGIFNVCTLPKYRRRGLGAAITRRAVEDGLAAGAAWAWLQSSPPGYPVYERLGFVTLERWDCWGSGSVTEP